MQCAGCLLDENDYGEMPKCEACKLPMCKECDGLLGQGELMCVYCREWSQEIYEQSIADEES